jgi:hypothetical protein
MNERYGWDKYKSEGLAELEKIKSIMSLPKDKDIIDLVERYIRLYKHKKISKKDDTKAVMLYPDLVEDGARKEAAKLLERVAEQKDKDLLHLFEKKSVDKVMKGILKDAEKNKMLRKKIEEPARDKACREAQKLRQFLEGFYNSAEGKESACRIYFVSDERDYRLGIKKADILSETKKEIMTDTASTESQVGLSGIKLHGSSRVKEILLDFLKIYPEAWAMPKHLVARSTASKTFNCDAIAIFLVSTILTVLIAQYYFSSFRFYIETASIHPVFIGFLINLLEKIEKPFDNILSFNLLFFIFRFTVITIIIPWLIYNKVFKGKVSIYEMMNFQFYFIMSWSPVFIWIGFAAVRLTFLNADITLLELFTTILGLWVLYTYYKCLYQLSGFTWKKGILPYTIYIPLHFWFIRTL